MRRLAKKVAATAMALTMTAAMATTCFLQTGEVTLELMQIGTKEQKEN